MPSFELFTISKRWSDDLETTDRIQDLENHEDREDLCNFIILLIRRSTFTWLSSFWFFSNLFQSKHLNSEVSNWFWADLSNFVVPFLKISRFRGFWWLPSISHAMDEALCESDIFANSLETVWGKPAIN